MNNYVVASSLDWFFRHPKSDAYNSLSLFLINKNEQLTSEFLRCVNPRYIFFPHWHWKVPQHIYENYECVAFHTAPLPYGRGGSPVQNLILRGLKSSPVCALKMTDIIDGGPIYGSETVSLDGTIEDIFHRIAFATEKLIVSICTNEPTPTAQVGEPTTFKRLTAKDNELLASHSIDELYDRIRMVDGLNYPRAYISFGPYRVQLTNAKLEDGKLVASAVVTKNDN